MSLLPDRPLLDPSDAHYATKQLLETKRPRNGEVEVTLWELCNIECSFCYLDKKSTVGMSQAEVRAKLELIERFFKQREGTVEMMQLNMVGGEIFQDDLLDEWLPIFLAFAIAARQLAHTYGYADFRIVWVSNFLFKRAETIKWFIEEQRDRGINASLICSYDVTGRPVNKVYARNIAELREQISTVNMVATVPTILGLLEGRDSFFDYLYETFDIYVDDYIPDPGHDDMLPSDTQLYAFYRFMLDKYPEVLPIRDMFDSSPQSMHCLSLNKLTIFPNNSVANCLWHRYSAADFVSPFDRDDNAGKMQTHMEVSGCLGCEYFERCGLRCFVQADWKGRIRDLGDCVMRKTFDYITGKESPNMRYDNVMDSLKARETSALVRKNALIPAIQL